MKIDIKTRFSPSCFLCDPAHFMGMNFGCKFRNEEMAAILKFKFLKR